MSDWANLERPSGILDLRTEDIELVGQTGQEGKPKLLDELRGAVALGTCAQELITEAVSVSGAIQVGLQRPSYIANVLL